MRARIVRASPTALRKLRLRSLSTTRDVPTDYRSLKRRLIAVQRFMAMDPFIETNNRLTRE